MVRGAVFSLCLLAFTVGPRRVGGVCGAAPGAGVDMTGTEFRLAFMRHVPTRNDYNASAQTLTLHVTNPSDAATNVNIMSQGLLQSTTIRATATLSVDMDTSLMLTSADMHTESVYVTSDTHVLVQASLMYSAQVEYSSGGFTVFPVTSLETDYIASTHCEVFYCVIAIVASQDSTDVTISLRIAGGGKADYRGQKFLDGVDIAETGLSKGQVVQVLCNKCDMTGTHVSSSKPVAVFSGGEFTKMFGMRYKDMVVEQVPPTTALGCRYVTGSDSARDLLKVVTLTPGDSFTFNGTVHSGTSPRQVFQFYRDSGQVAEIISSSPVFVAQFSRGQTIEESPDAIMTLPLPVERWARGYSIFLPLLDPTAQNRNQALHVCLIVPEGSRVQISHLSQDTQQPCAFSTTSSGNYSLMTLNITSSGLMTLSCDDADCKPFWGYVILFNFQMSSGLSLRGALPGAGSGVPVSMSEFCNPDDVTSSIATTASDDVTSSLATTVSDVTSSLTTITTDDVTSSLATTATDDVKSSLATTAKETVAPTAEDTVTVSETTATTETPTAKTETATTVAAPPEAFSTPSRASATVAATVITAASKTTVTTPSATTATTTSAAASTADMASTQPTTVSISTPTTHTTTHSHTHDYPTTSNFHHPPTQTATTPNTTNAVMIPTTPLTSTPNNTTPTPAPISTSTTFPPTPISTLTTFSTNSTPIPTDPLLCACRCVGGGGGARPPPREPLELLVRTRLSRYRRTKTTAWDGRPTSAALAGTWGVLVIVVILVLIVSLDGDRLCRWCAGKAGKKDEMTGRDRETRRQDEKT